MTGVQTCALPISWFYLPLWICITTPLTILALAFLGILSRLCLLTGSVKCLKRSKTAADDPAGCSMEGKGAARLFLFLSAAVPLLYALFFKPSLYNGW